MKAKIEAEGPLVLPKSVLDELGTRPGTVLDLSVKDGVLIARAETPAEAIRALYGSITLDKSTDEIIAELRDPQ